MGSSVAAAGFGHRMGGKETSAQCAYNEGRFCAMAAKFDVESDGVSCVVMRDSAGDGCAVVDHLLASAASDCAGDGCISKRSMRWQRSWHLCYSGIPPHT